MNQNPVQVWIDSVSYSNSQSKATEEHYKRVWRRFTHSTGMTDEQILADYENLGETTAKRKHAQLIQAWIGQLAREGLTNASIKVMVGAVKSFYKYNSLSLGHVPQARSSITYHNRDITKEEIIQIMSVSKIREKAFFVVMAQSGLRPHTIKQLKQKNLESFDKVPCKIDVPQEMAKGKYGSYVTFLGPDAIKYLRQYLATRTNLAQNSLLFCSHTDPTKMVNVKDESRAFRMAARKLEESGALNFEIREGKPSELRLYTLRKFFRKYANQMGYEHVNYVMGHTTKGSDSSYTPKDTEWYRDLYKERAMPFLRLETATPTETEKTIEELKKQLQARNKEIDAMKETITKLEPIIALFGDLDPENLSQFFKEIKMKYPTRIPDGRTVTTIRVSQGIDEELEMMAKKHGISKEEAASIMLQNSVTYGVQAKNWEEAEEKLKHKRSLQDGTETKKRKAI